MAIVKETKACSSRVEMAAEEALVLQLTCDLWK
jgi:hypothetical protein